jgi:hypothetical protein
VGYGRHWANGSHPPAVGRFIGRNKLTSSIDGNHVVRGAAAACDDPAAHKEDWATCGGDSGGPLINSRTGQIIGVTSTSVSFANDSVLGKKSEKLSVFTDITTGEGAKFVHDVLDDFQARQRGSVAQNRSNRL